MVTRVINTPSGFTEQGESLDPSSSQAPTSPLQETPPPTRLVDGAFIYNADSGEAVKAGVTKHQHAPESGRPGGSVIATRSKAYGRDTVCLVPGDEGTRTSVATAVRLGAIRETSRGFFQDVQQGDGAGDGSDGNGARAEDPEPNPSGHLFEAHESEAWASEVSSLKEHSYDHAVAGVIAVGALGMGSLEDVAKGLAVNENGMDPAQAAQVVKAGVEHHQKAVDRELSKLGLTGETLDRFYADVRKGPKHVLQQAFEKVAYSRDPSAFVQMAVQWKARHADALPEVKSANALGMEHFIDRKSGEVMVRAPGRQWVKARDLFNG